MGAEERYRYPWKPPYAPGWLLGWPHVWPLGVGEVEIESAWLEEWQQQEDVWQEDGMTAVSGGGYDGNDNKIPLHLQ